MRQIIDRRRLFERVKALVIGGMCPAWVGRIIAPDAVAAEPCERLPSFEFIGHHIGDGLHEKFPYLQGDSWTSREPDCGGDTSEKCHGDLQIRSRSGYPVGDFLVDLTYIFRNGKFSSVTVVFQSSFHKQIREMLIGKYGKTSYEYTVTRYNLGGRSFSANNTVSHWQFREGFLVLTGILLTDQVLTGNPISGLLIFHPYTVSDESPDQEAVQLRVLGKRAF